jgi:signal transduction histidine kinase
METAQDSDYRHTLRVAGRGEVPRLARVFNRMADRLRHTEQVRRDFVVEASQEIEEPLKNILNLASDQARQPEERLLAIQEAAGSMSWAVDQLLDMARLEIDPRPLRLEQFDFGSMINRVIDACRADMDTPGASVRREDRLDMPLMVDGDEARLQVAFNALLRFCLATAPLGAAVSVAISEDPANILAALTGGETGLKDDEIPLLFERFLSRLSRGQNALVGVPAAGLAMSRRIIELHRGMIEARRSSSGRLTFFVRVPKGGTRQ